MKNMTIKEIAAACGGTYYGSEERCNIEASNVVIDSRQVTKDSLFVAIKGARVDGHKFIPQVIENGALCAIAEVRPEDESLPYILVDSSVQALKDIAEHYRRSLDIKVVGISGSVGKTSTKEMIASVLEQKFHVLKTDGNFNNQIGLPLTVFRIREEHQIAVLEMGISEFGEMERLAKIARPDICVITNIGYAHLENLKTRDGILKAKTSMFKFMNPEGTVILNGDDDKLITVDSVHGQKPVFFGLSKDHPYFADDIKDQGLEGTEAVFHTPDSTFSSHIFVPGSHMVYNALAGIAVGRLLGMNDEEIAAGIAALRPVAGRNNLIKTDSLAIIDDCYNANPASMKASLDVLSKANGRKVAILGDMFELGEEEKEMHREMGAYAAQLKIDQLVCIGELSKNMAEGAKDSESTTVSWFATKKDFFDKIDTIIKKGDTILVKASHGMEFPEIVNVLNSK